MAVQGANFLTWDIDSSGLQQLKKNIKSLNSNHIEYGVLNKEKYPAGDPNGRAGMYVAEVAKDNEYGFTFTNENGKERQSPPRPFFYQANYQAKFTAIPYVKNIFAKLPVFTNEVLRDAMKFLADELADDIRHSIDGQDFDQNHLATVVRKYQRSTKILRNTDVMYNSFSGKVVKGTVPT